MKLSLHKEIPGFGALSVNYTDQSASYILPFRVMRIAESKVVVISVVVVSAVEVNPQSTLI